MNEDWNGCDWCRYREQCNESDRELTCRQFLELMKEEGDGDIG